ncbi:class I SAM-dependent DNA methyltransferase [Thalassotalea piscium]
MSNDFFEHKAAIYDNDKKRQTNVDNIANAIISNIQLTPEMQLMDFGSGTGLLLERIAPFVKKITAVDISKAMTTQLDKKRNLIQCEVDILQIDLATFELPSKFDGIISSMTMHHVKDIKAMFVKFYAMLNTGGFIAIADLDQEQGDFHSEDTGVFHFGFERDVIADAAACAGFVEINIVHASLIEKPHGKFPIFLLTAHK